MVLVESVHQSFSTESWFKRALLCSSQFSSLFLGFCHLFLLLVFRKQFIFCLILHLSVFIRAPFALFVCDLQFQQSFYTNKLIYYYFFFFY